MNTKKLIGTIIGVTLFVILIAGATYAWLSTTANVTNSVFNGTAKNFFITYEGSANISNLKQIPSGDALTGTITTETNAATADDGWAAVSASKTANQAPASSFKLNLAIATNTLASNSLIYAVCKGNCPTDVALATIDNGTVTCATGVAACNAITAGSTTTEVLYNDTETFNVEGAANQTYNVYFWLDSETLSNDDMGAEFSGYIYAEATQVG